MPAVEILHFAETERPDAIAEAFRARRADGWMFAMAFLRAGRLVFIVTRAPKGDRPS